MKVVEFRRQLYRELKFPFSLEMHFKQFIQNKKPYHNLYSDEERYEIAVRYFKLISSLDAQIINVVIDKGRINSTTYPVLENALKYSIQRVENAFKYGYEGSDSNFLIITDEGRVGRMRRTARKIQRLNYIPSNIYQGESYRADIQGLIEDLIPKKSDESFFIQLTDCVAYIVTLYALKRKSHPTKSWPKRVEKVLKENGDLELLETISNILNIKASKEDEFGVVYYPK